MTKYIVTVKPNGTRRWYNESGQLHRSDGPAIEYANGDKYWYQNSQLHRTDGPAVECVNSDNLWYQNDLIHRTDGPAVEYADGTKFWYQNNQLHRTDGPAEEFADGTKRWYIEGRELTEAEFLKVTKAKAPCEGRTVEVDGVRYKLVAV